MYKRILVPLDGSKLAECALPHAEELAKNCDPQYSQTGIYIGDQIHRRPLYTGKTLHHNTGRSQHPEHTTIMS